MAQITSPATQWYNPLQSEVIEMNPNTGSYYFYKLEGGQKGIPYKIMSADEFNKFQQQNAMRDAWVERRNTATEEQRGRQGGLIPSMRVNNDFFGKVFGGNEITITPRGSAEVTLGINNTYTDNPMIPSQYRSSTSPDFNTKLQFNVAGNIGDRLKLQFNYNTEATFDFEQEIKLQYVGDEDDIIQKIEAGNVSLPLTGTLITGSQSLFGIKTELKFGKFRFTGIVSQQKSQSKDILVQGGAQSRTFELTADQYDANRHFFLSQVFRDNYNKSLAHLPLIQSGINITKIEVWVTNKTNRFENSRSLVAFMDIGEPKTLLDQSLLLGIPPTYPSDSANTLVTSKINKNSIRDISNVTGYLSGIMWSGGTYTGGTNYEKLENARKLEERVDYTLNAELGYISLNTALNYDEVLAVAFEYTVNGVSHKVGELSTDGIISPNALVVKLLKGTNLTPALPNWKLMMKNVYSLDAYQLSKKNFLLDIYYQDSNAGTELPYISEGSIKDQPLIRVLNLDNLNSQNDPYPDGVFDFVDHVTVLASQGKIIFPVLEPFGSDLKSKIGNATIASKYIYQELYDSTLTKAREIAEKNKFKLVGSYQSDVASEIQLNAVNIPEGSIVVTAGSLRLTENVDYTVNYTMGTVRIINPGYLESGVPIKVSMEDRGLFNVIQKSLYGANLNYQVNKDFNIGATFLGLHERPLTQKASFGNDPMSNMIWGVNTSYRTQSNFITKMVDKLPFIQTKTPSQISIDAEFAQLLPGQSSVSQGKTFVDDFDGTQTSMDLRSFLAWHLSGTPGDVSMFPESQLNNNLAYGFRRSKLSWYTISTDFLRNTSATPAYIKANPDKYQKNHFVREIPVKEIYPNKDIIAGTSSVIATLNFTYYPMDRGPYNYQISPLKVQPSGLFSNPKEQWAGVMRSLSETDFEAANYEYIEFWLMDPFVYNQTATGGDLYINLGNISEDILKDGHKSFENGLPYPYDATKIIETAWGRVPKAQSLVYTFDNNYAARALQDVGFDGLNDEDERTFFKGVFLDQLTFLNADAKEKLNNDPSSDDYRYYFDPYYANLPVPADIIECYKDFNGPDGNSRTAESGGQNTMSNPNPDMEDINKDNTMNEVESYFQYRVRLTPADLVVGQNFIADQRVGTTPDKDGGVPVNWYQFKIPIAEYQKIVGDISDFKSIRFMRVFMTNFADTTHLRFASFDLIRSEWRKYNYSLIDGQEGMAISGSGSGVFDISTVNIEENANRTPINYMLPPGTSREIDPSTYQQNQLNEQSMQLKVTGLPDGDARAAYKSTLFDFRKFRHLQMDVHAEAVEGYPGIKDGDVSMFVRIGNDYRNNYYEYEIPLKISPWSVNNQQSVWPQENFLDIELDQLTQLKIERNQYIKYSGGSAGNVYEKTVNGRKLRIVGNPSLGTVRNIMIGLRNPAKIALSTDDGQDKSVIAWVDEMRLTDVDNKGGWAANARAASTLADFGSVSVSGNIKTNGFGSLESRINDRLINDTYQYDIITNFELGKFFSDRVGVKIPMFFGFSEFFETPYYNPYDQDVKLKDVLNSYSSDYQRDSLTKLTQTYTRRKAFSLNNVRIAPEGSQPHVFSVSNFSLSYSYNETFMRNMRTAENLQKNFNGMLSYTYNVQPKFFQPFKGVSGRSLSLIRDFSIGLYPKQFSFSTDMSRYYGQLQNRNIIYPDMGIPATYAKDFTWNRNYMLVYDLARSLTVNFTASNLARIDEPEGIVDRSADPAAYRQWRQEVWSNIAHFGRNVGYRQELSATWQVPLNKVGALNWISMPLTYKAGYEWVAAPVMADTANFDPGNTISNRQNYRLEANFGLSRLYNKSSFLRSINNSFSSNQKKNYGFKEVSYQSAKTNFYAKRKRNVRHGLGTTAVTTVIRDSEGREIKGTTRVVDKNNVEVTFDENVQNASVSVAGQVPKSQNPLEFTGELLLRLAMSVQTIQISYDEGNGTILPGFKPNSQLFGQSTGEWAPGWSFVFGKQSESFVDRARNKGWLTTDATFISPYMMTHDEMLNIRAEIEPLRDFKITLTGVRSYNTAQTMYNVVNPLGQKQAMGRFGISVISIGSAFESPKASNGFASKSYETFLNNRQSVAQLFASNRQANSSGYTPGSGAYPTGYGPFSQDVLIGSFLSAYAGKSINNSLMDDFPSFPMPNWDISYTGLSRITALKSIFRSATLRHSYTSTYSVNSFTLNRLYESTADGFSTKTNSLGDFIPYRDMANVSITEALNPLLQIDLGFANNLLLQFATSQNRAVALSLANNQITELRVKGYTAEVGYQFDNVPLLFNIEGRSAAKTKTMLVLRANFKYTDEQNILRKLDQSDLLNQIADGRNMVTMGFKADYTISDKVNMGLFFNRLLTKPYVSAIGTTNTNFGLSVRVLFSQ